MQHTGVCFWDLLTFLQYTAESNWHNSHIWGLQYHATLYTTQSIHCHSRHMKHYERWVGRSWWRMHIIILTLISKHTYQPSRQNLTTCWHIWHLGPWSNWSTEWHLKTLNVLKCCGKGPRSIQRLTPVISHLCDPMRTWKTYIRRLTIHLDWHIVSDTFCGNSDLIYTNIVTDTRYLLLLSATVRISTFVYLYL